MLVAVEASMVPGHTAAAVSRPMFALSRDAKDQSTEAK